MISLRATYSTAARQRTVRGALERLGFGIQGSRMGLGFKD